MTRKRKEASSGLLEVESAAIRVAALGELGFVPQGSMLLLLLDSPTPMKCDIASQNAANIRLAAFCGSCKHHLAECKMTKVGISCVLIIMLNR